MPKNFQNSATLVAGWLMSPLNGINSYYALNSKTSKRQRFTIMTNSRLSHIIIFLQNRQRQTIKFSSNSPPNFLLSYSIRLTLSILYFCSSFLVVPM